MPETNVFVTIRVNSIWTYNVSFSESSLTEFNFTLSPINDVTMTTFAVISENADSVQLVDALKAGTDQLYD